MKEVTVCFTRSNSMSSDSRIEKEMQALDEQNYRIIGIAWDREIKEKSIYAKHLKKQIAHIKELQIKSDFGSGFKKNIFPLLKFQIKLFLELVKRKKEIDIVHACDFDTALTSYIYCKIFKKKIVYDIYDFYVDSFNVPKELKKVIKKLDYKIINDATAVIICTDERKKQIKGSNPKKLFVVQNSPEYIEIPKDIELEKENSTSIKIGYFGILNDNRLIKELVDIVSSRNDLELLIGGFGKYEEYIIEKSKETTNIAFYGKLEYKKVLELESKCDILTALYDPIIPNHKYAAPNKFYEALMLGKPLIMCNNTGMSNVVENEKIGILIDEFNKSSLESGINSLIKIKNNWNDISKKEIELYKNNYSWNASKNKLLELYKQIERNIESEESV